MTDIFTVKLTGAKELQSALLKLPTAIQGRELDDAFKLGADLIAKQVADNLRAHGHKDMADAVVAVKSKRSAKLGPTSVYEVALKKPWSRLMHLFEFGTAERTQKSTGRFTGRIVAQPSMRPALDTKGQEAVNLIVGRLAKNVETMAAQLARDKARGL